MTTPRPESDLFIEALRGDLPTAGDEARVRARLLAAGLVLGTAATASSAGAVVVGGGAPVGCIAGGAVTSGAVEVGAGVVGAAKVGVAKTGFFASVSAFPGVAKVGLATTVAVAVAASSVPLVSQLESALQQPSAVSVRTASTESAGQERSVLLQPSIGGSSAVTPSAVTSSAVTSSAVTPSAVTPSAVTPSAVTPSAVTSNAVKPNAVKPNAGRQPAGVVRVGRMAATTLAGASGGTRGAADARWSPAAPSEPAELSDRTAFSRHVARSVEGKASRSDEARSTPPSANVVLASRSLGAVPVSAAPGEANAAVPEKADGAVIPDGAVTHEASLAEETRLIQQALLAIADGDRDRARGWLGEHAQRFPNGFLAVERSRAFERLAQLPRR
jgi:hypothetical protein